MKKILLVDSNSIALEGLKSIIQGMNAYALESRENLNFQLAKDIQDLDLLLFDYADVENAIGLIELLREKNPSLKVLAITNRIHKAKMLKALRNGVNSHLLKNCGKSEIEEAIEATLEGKQFFCEQVFDIISEENDREKGCEGVQLTEREVDIIKLIARGNTNKEVAEELNISAHTVNTHRKNIMAKLNINNVAGLVIYAFQEDLLVNQ